MSLTGESFLVVTIKKVNRLDQVVFIMIGGLDIIQWLISIAIGSLSLIVSMILKLFDENKCCPEVLFLIAREEINKKIL